MRGVLQEIIEQAIAELREALSEEVEESQPKQ